MKDHVKQDSVIISIMTAAAIFLVLLLFGQSQAAGLLQPNSGERDLISLKSHDVKVVINNGFARTEVDQRFTSSADGDLEAIYSFPLPKQASLSELSLWIDGREVVGEVLEKQRAREVYQQQKSDGKHTALATQESYRTFDVSVYPVRPDQETRVRLVYYQPLTIDQNVGRYIYPLAEGGVDEERLAFWKVDDTVEERFSFDVTLKSAHPIQDIRLPGHPDVPVERVDQQETGEESGYVYHARIEAAEGADLSQDILFYYRLDDTVPARVELVPFRSQTEGHGTFMLTITPAASLQRIEEGIDWTFVLDRSGSMKGGKIATLVDGVTRVIGKMSGDDRFRIVTFNDTAQEITGGYQVATAENISRVGRLVGAIQAERGTALHAGLDLGLKDMDNERTSVLVLVTDGVANIGPQRHADFLDLVKEQDVRLFTFVIGNSANRPLLESLAKASGGFSMDVSDRDDIYGRILQAKGKVLHEALHDVTVRFDGARVSGLTPAEAGSLYRGQQLVMFGKYQEGGSVTITLSAKISGKEEQWSCQATLPEIDHDNPEVERLWALSSISEIMEQVRLHGETNDLRQRVVALGREYSLVTEYTSMVVVDEQEREELGMSSSNSQRVKREREAQRKRNQAGVQSTRVDRSQNGGMFNGAPSPGIGTGPVGPAFLLVLCCGLLFTRKEK